MGKSIRVDLEKNEQGLEVRGISPEKYQLHFAVSRICMPCNNMFSVISSVALCICYTRTLETDDGRIFSKELRFEPENNSQMHRLTIRASEKIS